MTWAARTSTSASAMLFAAALSVDSNGLATESNSSHNQPDAYEVFFTPSF